MKYIILVALALVICFIISFLITYLIYRLTKRKIKKGIIIIITICGMFINFILIGFIYLGIYYHADSGCKEYLKSSEKVTVVKKKGYYFFDGKASNKAIVFYPGAKVEYTSYAPLMYKLAESGIDTFLMDMPLNIAFFGVNKASTILNNYSYESFYISGHSLGGSVASIYASKNKDKIDGVILLASYSTKSLDDLKCLSIYGSNDGVLNKKKYEENKKNLGECYREVVLDGGNHANFGNYGNQKGDETSTISKDSQQKLTIDAINDFFKP